MIRKACPEDAGILAQLSLKLWPEHTREEMETEFRSFLQNRECALFLAVEEAQSVGFAQCQLRHDYVEGTQSTPVGYLEGIFVGKAYQGKGIARRLLSACEDWARQMGCREFASDCELTNRESLAFHLKVGFMEANRIICFTKSL